MRTIDADALKANLRVSQGVLDDYGIVYVPYRDVIACIDDAPTVCGWISVKDRLPENARFVLICLGRAIPQIGRYLNEDGWWIRNSGILKSSGDIVTHWMPLPEVPEKMEDE